MKTLNKEGIKARFDNCEIKKSTTISDIKPYKIMNVSFNKLLRIVVPGKPVIDSRPRGKNGSEGIFFYNPHKAQLMKIFDEIYKDSDELKGICIMGPICIILNAYVTIPKGMWKILSNKEKALVKKEEFVAMVKPDVDNMEKINYDVLQDDYFSIILRDESIIANRTHKIFVDSPSKNRVEILIYYSDRIPGWAKDNIESSIEYLKASISLKYKFINQIPDDQWKKVFYKNIASFYKKTKKDVEKAVRQILRLYNKKDLELLEPNGTKEVAIENIIKNVKNLLKKIGGK